MMKVLATLLFLMTPVWAQTASDRISAALNDWHQAAAVADEERYFGHFAANAVFLGTDASERWTVQEFREWARPHFLQKKTWNFKPRDRHIAFSADGKTGWFDEMLDTQNLGVCRGSGVVILTAGEWRIAQYNLSVPIPNALVDGIVKGIAGAGK